jgi:hypothetical protein
MNGSSGSGGGTVPLVRIRTNPLLRDWANVSMGSTSGAGVGIGARRVKFFVASTGLPPTKLDWNIRLYEGRCAIELGDRF